MRPSRSKLRLKLSFCHVGKKARLIFTTLSRQGKGCTAVPVRLQCTDKAKLQIRDTRNKAREQ